MLKAITLNRVRIMGQNLRLKYNFTAQYIQQKSDTLVQIWHILLPRGSKVLFIKRVK